MAADLLHLRFVKTARRRFFSLAMADSTGAELTFGSALAAGLSLSRWIRSKTGDQQMVGLMLPASVGGAVANIAVLLAGKIPVNLNFTAGREAVTSAIAQCRIRTVLTSRVFLTKARLEAPEGACFLEDAAKEIGSVTKAAMWIASLLLPASMINWLLVRSTQNGDDLATVIFSSGSTGAPKGVMLSHRNVLTVCDATLQVYRLTSADRMMSVLPLFHSFGFTMCLWFPVVNGLAAVFHANPMDAAAIGDMVRKYRATIILSTPTFYAAYTRKCTTEDFASLRFPVVGAEKLRESIARAFSEKYGLNLLEGYGCTEMGPVVSVNAPDDSTSGRKGMKAGTVGRVLPGMEAKTVDIETGRPLGPGQEGLLLVKGANRMLGYLNAPEKTREVLRDGWYVTGDVATIDEDGFIRLTDRLSRFSKIAGEMVPHLKIEEALAHALGEAACVVTAIPDEARGEKLVALYTDKAVSRDELWSRLSESDLPKLWLPKRENLFYVDVIPQLGTGKVDLKAVRALALQLAGGMTPSPA